MEYSTLDLAGIAQANGWELRVTDTAAQLVHPAGGRVKAKFKIALVQPRGTHWVWKYDS